MLAPVRTADPPALLSLDEAKDHLRIDLAVTDDDQRIQALIVAAEAHLDGWSGWLGRCILVQAWTVTSCGFTFTRLPFPDVRSAEVTYLDPAGASQVLDPSAYRVANDVLGGYVEYLADTPLPALSARPDPVAIEARFSMAQGVEAVRVAALMLVDHWFHDRSGAQGLPPAVAALLAPLRVARI